MLQHLLHQPLWGEVIGWSAALSHFPISYIWVRCFTLSACLLGGVCAWLEPWHMKMTSGQWQQSIFFFALVLELITCHNKSLWTRTCISEESNTICGITSIITRRYRQKKQISKDQSLQNTYVGVIQIQEGHTEHLSNALTNNYISYSRPPQKIPARGTAREAWALLAVTCSGPRLHLDSKSA